MLLRFLFAQLLTIVMHVLSVPMMIPVYLFRKSIWKAHTRSKRPLLWYFTNCQEPTYREAFFGYSGKVSFFHFVGFTIFRNGVLNFKVAIFKGVGKKTDIKYGKLKGDAKKLKWINNTMRGRMYATFRVNGTKYFRYSFTNRRVNVMLGAGENRWIVKFRAAK